MLIKIFRKPKIPTPVVQTIPVQIPTLQYLIPSQKEPFLSSGSIDGDSNNLSWKFELYNFPNTDLSFMDYNPTIELMRYKRKNRKADKINYKNIFVHPTHNNGESSNGKSYNGGAQFDNGHNPIPNRQTEWPYTPTTPFGKVIIDFNIGEWKGFAPNLLSNSGHNPLPIKLVDWEQDSDPYLFSTGQAHAKNHKTDVFSFRLRIDNPDSGDQMRPYLYGEMSAPWKVYPKIGMISGELWVYGWKISRCQFAKNR